ncbi:MAG TPA: type IV secretion system DNA-binding domain-containing protein [Pirellulales bacterium]|nr:type IV secretion system DNA-binding domain-containing protein [Pirellulales bacterium]
MIVGESGSGKTYAICCLLAELARQGVVSIVFDYGQGFSRQSLSPEFVQAVKVVELHASRDGIDVNPLRIFPSDVHGPVNAAQRVADTFARVYPKIGVQQHAVLRQAVLDVLYKAGINGDDRNTWAADPPAFKNLHDRLNEVAANGTGGMARHAASVASHVATLFFFNTLRPNGQKLDWAKMLRAKATVFVIQLRGLELSLERAVTEFLLWNLIGFIESLGPGPLRSFAVLDEAHKISFNQGSPVEKLLREGRKFGVGVILASQQPDDFSPVAFANTATKLIFKLTDDQAVVARHAQRRLKDENGFNHFLKVFTQLPRGSAYCVLDNCGRAVAIADLASRFGV